MKTYIFNYIVDTNLNIPIEAKNVKSAKNKLEKILKQPRETLVRDYNTGFIMIESEEFITDEDRNVIEEEE